MANTTTTKDSICSNAGIQFVLCEAPDNTTPNPDAVGFAGDFRYEPVAQRALELFVEAMAFAKSEREEEEKRTGKKIDKPTEETMNVEIGELSVQATSDARGIVVLGITKGHAVVKSARRMQRRLLKVMTLAAAAA